MSTLWTAQDLVAATGGQWLREPPPGWTASGFCYAAAIHQPGDMLFVRSYLGELGMLPLHARPLLPHSTGVLCTTADVVPDGPWPAFLVPEAYTGLMDVARYARGCFRGRVHAVTGSAGKTSICALLAFALSRLGPTITTSHNTNLPPGVARTLAGVPPSAGHVVLELAIGRMGTSTRLARPHVAIFSNVAAAHLKYHTTLEQVAERKSLIFTGLEPGGTAVLNRNMDHFDVVVTAARRHAGRVVTYGEGPTADLRLVNHTPDGVVRAVIHGEPVEYVLGPPGRHMALNSLAVLAALEAEGMDWRHHVLPALAEARPVAGRGEAHDLLLDGRALRLIDDAYNANPASMRAGIGLLGSRSPGPGGRRVAVLGDMLELGPDSARFHTDLAGPLEDAGVDVVHTTGPEMARLWECLPAAQRGVRVDTATALIAPLVDDLRAGDVVLVKGSHGSGVHQVVSELLARAERSPQSKEKTR